MFDDVIKKGIQRIQQVNNLWNKPCDDAYVLVICQIKLLFSLIDIKSEMLFNTMFWTRGSGFIYI